MAFHRAGVSGGNSLKALPRAHTEAAAALDYVHRSKPVLAYTDIRELGQPALSLPFHDRQLTELIRSGRDVRRPGSRLAGLSPPPCFLV